MSSAATSSSPVVRQGISVACRVRPLSSQETLNPKAHIGVRCLEDSIILEAPPNKNGGGTRSSTPKDRQYHLDHVFHSHTSQDEVYRTSCQHVVKALFDGINGSILAYGSTGAGKTYTMFGSGLSAGGVIYQAVQDIFDEKERLEACQGKYVAITCTFLEVYNEEVFDLLAKKRQPLAIREDEGNQLSRGGGTVNVEALSIKGLTRAAPRDIVEFDGIIELGRKNRFTATTNANEQSSRSHAIISVEVEVRANESSTGGTIARIRLCDLAGSERASATTNRGVRIREGGNINKSLLALGTVVQALAKRSKLSPSKASEVFVPYRGSKLTRLLRDCLGGNCYTSMLFCVTPSITGFEESCNTMLFAMQAKLVQVAAKRNEFTVNVAEVARNQENIIERLRTELAIVKEELLRVCHETGRGPVDFNVLMLEAQNAMSGGGEGGDCVEAITMGGGAAADGGGGSAGAMDRSSSAQPTRPGDSDETLAIGASTCNGGVGLDGLVSDHSSSPVRHRSSSMVQGATPMMSPKVVTLVDGGSLILEGGFHASMATPRAPTPTQGGAAGGPHVSMARSRNPSVSLGHHHHNHNAMLMSGGSINPGAGGNPVSNVYQHDAAHALLFAELKQRLKDVTDEKTDLHRELQANSDKQASLELQMRRERLGLCELMAAMPRGELPNPPPIRIIGQMQAISQAQSRLNDLKNGYKSIATNADNITAKVNAIGKETLRERTNNPVIELLVENASLRFALLDAEAFASEYNSKLSQAEAKYDEAADALHRCQEILRDIIPVADARDKERERDYDRAALLAASGAGGGAAPLLSQPPASIGRKVAAALALSTASDSKTDDITDQFRRVFAKCYAKLTSKGAMLGYDNAAVGDGGYIGGGSSSSGGGLSGLADTPMKNRASTNNLKKASGVPSVLAGGGGSGGANAANSFARTLSHIPSSSTNLFGATSGGSGGGGGSTTPPATASSVLSSTVSGSATALGGGGGSGANSNAFRLVSSNPQSMLSSQTMRDLRKKAGALGVHTSIISPSGGGGACGGAANSGNVSSNSTNASALPQQQQPAGLSTPSRSTHPPGSSSAALGGGGSTVKKSSANSHADPTTGNGVVSPSGDDIAGGTMGTSWGASTAAEKGLVSSTTVTSSSSHPQQQRNTSPYKGGSANNGGGGVGFTVSKANGRASERAKAPTGSGGGGNASGSGAIGAASFSRAATAFTLQSGGSGASSSGSGSSASGKAPPNQIIRPRDGK